MAVIPGFISFIAWLCLLLLFCIRVLTTSNKLRFFNKSAGDLLVYKPYGSRIPIFAHLLILCLPGINILYLCLIAFVITFRRKEA